MSASSIRNLAFTLVALALAAPALAQRISKSSGTNDLIRLRDEKDEKAKAKEEKQKKDDAESEAKPAGGAGGDAAKPKAAIMVEEQNAAPEAPPPAPVGPEKTAIAEIIRAQTEAVVRCYERAVDDKPTLQGKLYVVFYIGPNGRVIGATTQGINEPALTNCILPLVRKWEFEKPRSGGKLMVKYPFVFTPRPR